MQEPAATITAYEGGPLLVRGSYGIVNDAGEVVELRRRTVALCRCGRSRIKPWCDGTHKQPGGTPAWQAAEPAPGKPSRVTEG